MANKKLHQSKKKAALESMGGKCQLCGYDKCHRALHFHHVESSEKEFHFDKITYLRWEDIANELKKCILLCANCHAEIHSGMTIIPDSYARYSENLIKTDYNEFAPTRLGLNRNWEEIQNYYNEVGCDTNSLARKFHVSTETISAASKLGLFVRNPRKGSKTKKQIEDAVKQSLTRVDALRKLEMRPGGRNNKRINGWIQKYGLDISHFTKPSGYRTRKSN